jgi:hypothetical protein
MEEMEWEEKTERQKQKVALFPEIVSLDLQFSSSRIHLIYEFLFI